MISGNSGVNVPHTIVVHPDGTLSGVLRQRFPFAVGRIDWRYVPGAITLARGPSDSGDISRDVDEIVAFLQNCRSEVQSPDTVTAVVGDNTDHEFEVPLAYVAAQLRRLPNPEHKYVFALDGSWCLMWSMEGDVKFGKAPTDLPRHRRP